MAIPTPDESNTAESMDPPDDAPQPEPAAPEPKAEAPQPEAQPSASLPASEDQPPSTETLRELLAKKNVA